MEFVAFIGKDKESWGQVKALMSKIDSGKIILVKDKLTEDFIGNEKCKIIDVDTSIPLNQLKENLKEKLKKELSGDFEVALSIASGSGKEHMALISALLNIPLGVRFVAYTKDGVEFLS